MCVLPKSDSASSWAFGSAPSGLYPIYYWVTRTEYILGRLEGDYHA